MNKTKPRIIVSGTTGLLGSHILRHLMYQKDYELIGIHKKSSSLDLVKSIYNHISWQIGDILDLDFLDAICHDVDYFIHAAGKISFHKKDVPMMNEINVQGTSNVVDACLLNNVKKLVHISSVAALGRPEHTNQISELTDWEVSKHNTDYACSKRASDMEIFRGEAEGLNTCIVYPSTILGKGDWSKGSTRLFGRVQEGLKYYTNGINGFVDVRDVAKIVVKLIVNKIELKGLIVSAENLSYQSVFNEMAKHLNVQAPHQLLSNRKARVALILDKMSSWLTGSRSNISEDSIKVALSKFHYNNDLSKRIFKMNYIPIKQSIEETCKALIESNLKQHTK